MAGVRSEGPSGEDTARRRRSIAACISCTLLLAGAAHADAPSSARLARLEAAIAAAPRDGALRLARARFHLDEGEMLSAAADLELAEHLGASADDCRLLRAELRLSLGDAASIDALLDALREPAAPRAAALRARAAATRGDAAAEARAWLAAVDGDANPAPDALLALARAAARSDDAALDAAATARLDAALARHGAVPALVAARAELGGAAPTITARIAPDPASGTTDAARAAPVEPVRLVRGPYLQMLRPDAAVVRWRTEAPAPTRVAYGDADGDLARTAGDGALRTEHEVALSGLRPGTRVAYRIHGGTRAAFRTLPAPGSGAPLRIWVTGDGGTGDANARRVRNAFRAHAHDAAPDVWLMLGDNAYEDGTDAEYQAGVFDMYPSLLARTAVWPALGNHDGRSAFSATQTGPFFDIFTLPTRGEAGGVPSGTEAYYAFDAGDVHFVCLDSFHSDRRPDGAMAQWLARDLAAARAAWTIAYFHHPPYSKGGHDSDDAADSGGRLGEMRRWIVPILEAHGVDLVLAGHSHDYERSFLIDGHHGPSTELDRATMVLDGGDGRPDGDGAYRKPADPRTARAGAVYVVAGSSGKISDGPLNHPVMCVSLLELGSLVIDVEGARLVGRFLDQHGIVRDEFALRKAAPAAPPAAAAPPASPPDPPAEGVPGGGAGPT